MTWKVGLGLLLLFSAVIALASEKDGDLSTEAAELNHDWSHDNYELMQEKGLEETTEDQINEERIEDVEPQRRSRQRTGSKRRRRMRKRPRTTPVPFQEDEAEEVNIDDHAEISFERRRRLHDDLDTRDDNHPQVRRRPVKRRRRPQRRYPDRIRTEYPETRIRDDLDLDVPRKRRKGGRKRIRDPHFRSKLQQYEEETPKENQEEVQSPHIEITTQETEIFASSVLPEQRLSIIYDPQYMFQPEPKMTESLQDNEPVHSPSSQTPKLETTEEPWNPAAKKKTDNDDDYQIATEELEILKENEKLKQEETTTASYESNSARSSNQRKNIKEPEIMNKNEEKEKKEFDMTRDDIIFDRKKLFPSSRRLPPTSAIIRRRLRPKLNKSNKTYSSAQSNQNEGALINTNNSPIRNEILHDSLIPHGFTATPELISPTELINGLKAQISVDQLQEGTTEEPNYPKISHIFAMKDQQNKTNKSTENHNIIANQQNVNIFSSENETNINETAQKEEISTTFKSILVKTDETLKYEALDIPNVKDDILDLLKSETGSSRLAKILELRNMTLVELIEHRERGSSQLHLSDIFKRRQSAGEVKKKLDTGDKNQYPNNNTRNPHPITFPSEEILGSFPKFLLEQIDKKNFTYDEAVRLHSQESRKALESKINDTREPRLFQQLPKNRVYESPTTDTFPSRNSWQVIPNPNLTPVSVQGHFEEIYLTKFQSTDKPIISAEENEVFLLGETDNPIIHRNELGGQLSAESVKINERTTFRRIPPGMKSAIIVSGAILLLAIFGFLSVLISCRVRQRRARLRAKQDILCEHLQNEDFMNSQRSLSPVLTKTREPVFSQGIHSNTTSNRHYYLWRTLRKTFQYD